MTRPALGFAIVALAIPAVVSAQPLGTFRWQLQPYCNVVSLTVTQVGAQYRVEGTDDQCGAGRDLASAIGMAFQNPDGTIGFGLTIVVAPGGAAVNIDAEISLATLSGTWRDSTGATGTFAFRTGAGTGGTPRPQPGGGRADRDPAAWRWQRRGRRLGGDGDSGDRARCAHDVVPGQSRVPRRSCSRHGVG